MADSIDIKTDVSDDFKRGLVEGKKELAKNLLQWLERNVNELEYMYKNHPDVVEGKSYVIKQNAYVNVRQVVDSLIK